MTDGRPGIPLELRMTVQEAGSCDPIEGTDVEIWHSDAGGAYSGVEPGDDSLFLRGHQKSDAAGEVRFDTIYPGWYMGRTTHIHVKVHAGGDTVHTGQLYFDYAVSAAVYATDPYASRGGADTTNATDGIYANGGAESTLDLREPSGASTPVRRTDVRATQAERRKRRDRRRKPVRTLLGPPAKEEPWQKRP